MAVERSLGRYHIGPPRPRACGTGLIFMPDMGGTAIFPVTIVTAGQPRAGPQPRQRVPAAGLPGSWPKSPSQRTQGMPGARRARGLACETKKHTSKSTTGRPNIPAFPARWFYNLFRALSGDRAFCHRRLRKLRKLRASIETLRPHGFVVRRLIPRQLMRPRPSHPAPDVRDDREAPSLVGHRMREEVPVICPSSQAQAAATNWHDGQISCRRTIASRIFLFK